MGIQFSTQELRPSERFDYWHELVFRTYARCVGSVSSQNTFHAHLTAMDFGAIGISDVGSTSVKYERRSYDVRIAPSEDVFFSLMLEGSTNFEQAGERITQRQGDVLIYDAARPYTYDYDQGYHSLLMRVPRPVLAARNVDADRLRGLLLPVGTPFGRLVGSLIRETRQIAPDTEAGRGHGFSSAVLDMISASLQQATGDGIGNEPGSGDLLDRIKRNLRENLGDSTLTLEEIARDQNVSVRTLCRLFASAGTTPMRWLQEQRLESAYRSLAERKARNVTEAAYDCGFNDVSHFGRAFKKTYGVTPKSLIAKKTD